MIISMCYNQDAPLRTLRYLLADISNLSCFTDDFFDIVTAFDVLEHVQNPSKALDEINRVLRDGGLSVITTPNLNSIGRYLKGSKCMEQRIPHITH